MENNIEYCVNVTPLRQNIIEKLQYGAGDELINYEAFFIDVMPIKDSQAVRLVFTPVDEFSGKDGEFDLQLNEEQFLATYTPGKQVCDALEEFLEKKRLAEANLVTAKVIPSNLRPIK